MSLQDKFSCALTTHKPEPSFTSFRSQLIEFTANSAEVATLRLGEETLHLVRPDQRTALGPFLGIDHTAIAVSDLDVSLAFYSDTLGFELTARGVNAGPSEDALDGLGGAQVEIAVLSPSSSKGPHLELLHYRHGR